jgi:hypothetical protein
MPEYVPPPTPLYPAWDTPKGQIPAIFAWRAYVNPAQSLTGSTTSPRPLSDVPAQVYAMVYYHSADQQDEPKTFDYGDSKSYVFYLPDGTTRTTPTMSAQAYKQLVTKLWSKDDGYPP